MNDPKLSRRSLIAGVGATAALGPLCFTRSAAASSAPPHTFKVGAAEVIVISDGDFTLPLSFVLPGRPQADIDAVFQDKAVASSGIAAEVNVVLIRLGAELILVDTGAGPDFMPTLGRLADRLEAAGIKPDQITKVVFTHAHPDHLWGVIDPLGGGSQFEKAQHVMSRAERDFWLKPDVDRSVAEPFKAMAAGSHRRLKSIADRVETPSPGTELVPGLALVETVGHTPGHCSLLLRSGNEQLMIGGDALVNAVVSFAEPGWRWGSDMDPDAAATTRSSLLDRLASEKISLIGYHLPWPGIGRVERAGTRYRFIRA